jgi:hypothetical protein
MALKSERHSAATKPPSRRNRMRLGRAMQHSSDSIDRAVSAARTGVSHLPGTMHATRVGAKASMRALQVLPDPTLQGLAAGSVGLATGFYLAGVPRLLTVAGVAPAMFIAAAILLRPKQQVRASEAAKRRTGGE